MLIWDKRQYRLELVAEWSPKRLFGVEMDFEDERWTQPLIDAHQHFWDLRHQYRPWLCDVPPPRYRYGNYEELRRNYLPEDYREATRGFNVEGTVYVEGEWNPADPIGETHWVHALAERDGLPTVMVAQAWFDRSDCADVIAEQAGFSLVRGIRQKPSIKPHPVTEGDIVRGSMSDPQWRKGYEILGQYGLSFDLQVPWWHLHETAELAADFPHIPIAINHAGQIDSRDVDTLLGWRRALEAVACQPNVVLKISGLGLAGRRWSLDDNLTVIRTCISVFGTNRCMFASNYPVDNLIGNFRSIYHGFATACADLSGSDRAKLFHDNARNFYRMK